MKKYEFINLDSIDSTNDYAVRMSENIKLSEDNVYVITAKEQTKGKGRLGRSFESIRDKGIFASFLLKPNKKTYEVANITLMVALALARALDRIIPDKVSIKWPNDIILNERKLSGILTELKNDQDSIKCLVIGIGVNVNNESFADCIKDKATSLYMEYGKTFDKDMILKLILEEFDRLYERFLSEKDLAFMAEEYNHRLINRNDTVVIEYKGEKREALQLGIDNNGMLEIMLDGEKRKHTSGEILVRGVGGYV